jgi:hypothetical protein
MASKESINKLSGKQARIALLFLLEKSYNTPAGAIWNQKIDEAIKIAETYPPND